MQEIEAEFGAGGHPRPLRQAIRDDPARVGRCIKGVARVAFRDVVHRFHKSGGGSDPMFYQYAAGPADRSGNRQIDPGGGILVNAVGGNVRFRRPPREGPAAARRGSIFADPWGNIF